MIKSITKPIISPILKNIIISDSGEPPINLNLFISTWNTANAGVSGADQIALPVTVSSTYPFDVVYNGSIIKTVTGAGDNVVTFPDGAGIKTISIDAPIGSWAFNGAGDRLKILDIGQWGQFTWGNASGVFSVCSNLDITATDAPSLAGTTSLINLFNQCSNLTRIGGNWDVSNILSFGNTFRSCPLFNQDISSWNVSNGTNFSGMFDLASIFNQDISSWNVSNGTNFSAMFAFALKFNQDISGWDVSNGTNFANMLRWALEFNQDISSWNVSNGTSFSRMFTRCLAFNQDLSSWNVSNGTNFSYMFENSALFDSDLSGWNVSNATNMTNFLRNTAFSTANYDLLLVAWNLLTLQNNVSFHAGNAQYNAGAPATARANIISTYAWTITDGGQVP